MTQFGHYPGPEGTAPEPEGAAPELDWRQFAQCDTESAHLFTVHHRETKRERMRREDSAKSLCQSCPVLSWCLDYAINNGENEGIWGGLNTVERAYVAARQMTSGDLDRTSA